MLDLIDGFPDQWEKGWELGEKQFFSLPEELLNIVVLGMGGSAIGGDILQALAREKINCPVIVNRDYSLPPWVGENSLVIAVSYSGNTEETLTSLEKAKEQNATVWGVSSGGMLKEKIEKNYLQIPAGLPPRAALGYTLAPVLALFNNLGLMEIPAEEIEETREIIGEINQENGGERGQEGPAALLAEKLADFLPLIYGPGALGGVAARRWKCQINENSKAPSFWAEYPELNHNELVGWEEPEEVLEKIKVVNLLDYGANPRNKKRMEITAEILQKKGVGVQVVPSQGKYPLARVLSLIYFGDYVSFYLAQRYGIDPGPVPIIEKLKGELKNVD